MRKFLVLLLAMAMVLAVASPALAKYVSNSKVTREVVEGYWSTGEWGDETISSGFMAASRTVGAKTGEIYFSQSVGQAVVCDAGTPDDDSDDWFGYEWIGMDGWGPATVSIAKSYTAGEAAGTVDVWTYEFSDCDFYYEYENGGGELTTLEVSLSMTGISPLVKEVSSYSFHIPGQYNDRSKYQSTYREAVGTATVGEDVFEAYGGRIGKYTETYHSNGK